MRYSEYFMKVREIAGTDPQQAESLLREAEHCQPLLLALEQRLNNMNIPQIEQRENDREQERL